MKIIDGIAGGMAILVVAIVVGLFVWMLSDRREMAATPQSKVVVLKHTAVEPRVRFNWLGGRFDHVPQTVYYLVGTDGSFVEVSLSTYLTTKEGDRHVAHDWRGHQ